MTESVVNPKGPLWAKEPVQRLLSNVRQIHEFYHLTRDGLQMIIHHHEFLARADARIKQLTVQVEIHGGTVGRNDAEESKRAEAREHAKKRADLSLQEVSGGFPVLHRQQVVFLWGAIETVAEDTLVAWLKNENLVVSDQRLRKIKVSLADFNTMSESEKLSFGF
jgi:hypothetical protein